MLLRCVEDVVARKGYQGATVPDVVAAAGVAQGCFYRYFRSIDDAFLAAIERLTSELERASAELDFARVRRRSDLEARLVEYFRVLGRLIAEHPTLLGDALLVAPAAPGAVGRAASAFSARMHAVARDLLQAHSGRPPFREVDAEVVAGAVVGMILGGAREALRLGAAFDAERWAVEMARFEAGALTARARTAKCASARRSSSTADRPVRRRSRKGGRT